MEKLLKELSVFGHLQISFDEHHNTYTASMPHVYGKPVESEAVSPVFHAKSVESAVFVYHHFLKHCQAIFLDKEGNQTDVYYPKEEGFCYSTSYSTC